MTFSTTFIFKLLLYFLSSHKMNAQVRERTFQLYLSWLFKSMGKIYWCQSEVGNKKKVNSPCNTSGRARVWVQEPLMKYYRNSTSSGCFVPLQHFWNWTLSLVNTIFVLYMKCLYNHEWKAHVPCALRWSESQLQARAHQQVSSLSLELHRREN